MSIKLETSLRLLGPAPDSPYAYDFTLKNLGSSACSTSGWAGVIFRGDYVTHICLPGELSHCGEETHTSADWRLVTHHAAGAERVVVQPGKTVSFSAISVSYHCSSAEGFPDAHLGSPYELDVVLPEGAGTFAIRKPNILAPCDGVWEITAFGTKATYTA